MIQTRVKLLIFFIVSILFYHPPLSCRLVRFVEHLTSHCPLVLCVVRPLLMGYYWPVKLGPIYPSLHGPHYLVPLIYLLLHELYGLCPLVHRWVDTNIAYPWPWTVFELWFKLPPGYPMPSSSNIWALFGLSKHSLHVTDLFRCPPESIVWFIHMGLWASIGQTPIVQCTA